MTLHTITKFWQDWNAFQRKTAVSAHRYFQLQQQPPTPESLQLAPTPAQTIYQLNKIRLLRYQNLQREETLQVPLLLVPSLINRYYILDLQPNRSLVAYLVQQGFDVWIVDWGTPGREDRFDSLDDYLVVYLDRLVRRVIRETAVSQISILGYSIGGLLATLYTTLYPEIIANLINLAGPIDFSTPGLLNDITDLANCDVDTLVDVTGNVPKWFIKTAFDNLIPFYHARQTAKLWKHLENEQDLKAHFGIRYWLEDNVEMPGEFTRQYIQGFYQQNLLVQGGVRINGRVLHLSNINCPVLTVAAAHDHIAPPESVLALHEHVNSNDKQTLTINDGHVGLVTNCCADQKLFPQLVNWLSSRSSDINL